MTNIYVKLILAGRKSIDDVPEHLKNDVLELLDSI